MLEYCIKIYETYLNDKLIGKNYGLVIIPQGDISQIIYEQITWASLQSVYKKYGILLPFTIWHRKKGRQISFFNHKNSKDIKEWKTTSPNMYLKIHYEKRTASLKTILDYHNSDLAIQYLVERGLSVVG